VSSVYRPLSTGLETSSLGGCLPTTLTSTPIAELQSYVSRIQREKIAHVVEGKEGFALVLEQPELGFDKFAPSVEGGLKQVSLKAVDRFAKNSSHKAAKRFGLSIPAPFSAKLS